MSPDVLYRLSELERRLANVARIGTIAQINTETARVRVSTGGALTWWLPWLTQRAGSDRSWWAPSVGEQVLLIAPSGDLAQAVAMPSIYQDAHAAPADDAAVHRVEYSDGAIVEYDATSHKLTATIPGDVEATATGDITADAGGAITATAGGDVQADAGGSINATAVAAINLTAPSITLNGVVAINGPLTQGAGMGGGNATLAGTLTVTGGVTTPADVVASGKSLATHIHAETGGDTLPPT